MITLLENFIIAELDHSDNETTVNLISIYDKGDTDTISDKEIKRLVDIFRTS